MYSGLLAGPKPFGRGVSLIPSFFGVEHAAELGCIGHGVGEAFDEGCEPVLRHGGDQVVEHAALPEQRVGARLAGVGLEKPVHAEALADRAQQGEQGSRKGADQKQPVAPGRLADASGAEPHAKAQVFRIAEVRLDRPPPRVVVDQLGSRRLGAWTQTTAPTCRPFAVTRASRSLRARPDLPTHSAAGRVSPCASVTWMLPRKRIT